MERAAWVNLAYLAAAVLFIFGIKGLTHPRTAVRGNLISSMAMLLAIVVTLAIGGIDYLWIAVGLAIGAVAGAVLAIRVPMTGMPQMVALLNGFGGGASVCVAWAELINPETTYDVQGLTAIAATGLIGSVTFWGSLVAWAKLQELQAFRKPLSLPAHQLINALLALLAIGLGAWLVADPQPTLERALLAYLLLVIVASVLGVMLTMPIGGADMPVVIALLNSYSGLAAAAAGFIIENTVLIITGSLVGASGLILTSIMCKAMNRSLWNVMFGSIAAAAPGSTDDLYEGKVKSTTADEIAMLLDGAQRVVIVPGYGMAVAQAQHATRDLYNVLAEHGANVEFAIHPVAGRMPGHMNVLLAEVDIPYEKLREMESINPEFGQVDIVLVIGANDVVNPDARTPGSPIAGMPILDVDKARTVVVIKRSLSPGFAGLANPLFAADNCLMYFADGKKAVLDIVTAVKGL